MFICYVAATLSGALVGGWSLGPHLFAYVFGGSIGTLLMAIFQLHRGEDDGHVSEHIHSRGYSGNDKGGD